MSPPPEPSTTSADATSSEDAAGPHAAAAGAPWLQALALRCERAERALFSDLDFALAAGEVMWLRGRNGRGKTTLLRTLAGLSPPAAGEVRWRGRTPAEAGAAARAQLLHLGHANALKDDLTIAESLRFFARLLGRNPDAAAIAMALDRVGLPGMERRHVRTLSQGQRRRVALARLALAPRPAVWLLDEPFDALDDDGIARLAALILEQAGAGGAVLFTSHFAVPELGARLRTLELDRLG